MIQETDKAYIAGLFDGEGSIHFKRGIEKKKKHKGRGHRLSNSLRLSMEITMTDRSVLIWLHEVLGVGTLTNKPRKEAEYIDKKHFFMFLEQYISLVKKVLKTDDTAKIFTEVNTYLSFDKNKKKYLDNQKIYIDLTTEYIEESKT